MTGPQVTPAQEITRLLSYWNVWRALSDRAQVRNGLRIASLLKGRFTDAVGCLGPDIHISMLPGNFLKSFAGILPLLPTLIRDPDL